MYNANIQIVGFFEFSRILETTKTSIRPVLKHFAGETRDFMRDNITRGIRRKPSSGTLAKSIKVKETKGIDGTVSFSVGDPNDLPVYWEVVNNGGYFTDDGRSVIDHTDDEIIRRERRSYLQINKISIDWLYNR